VQSELEWMLRGQGETWTRDFLLSVIKCDHGFTAASPPVQFFVDVLAEMSTAEQRAFLRFVTGSPRLPPGGLAALRPQVTLVAKRGSRGTFSAHACEEVDISNPTALVQKTAITRALSAHILACCDRLQPMRAWCAATPRHCVMTADEHNTTELQGVRRAHAVTGSCRAS
jgi:hypothetical protein